MLHCHRLQGGLDVNFSESVFFVDKKRVSLQPKTSGRFCASSSVLVRICVRALIIYLLLPLKTTFYLSMYKSAPAYCTNAFNGIRIQLEYCLANYVQTVVPIVGVDAQFSSFHRMVDGGYQEAADLTHPDIHIWRSCVWHKYHYERLTQFLIDDKCVSVLK